MSVHVKPVSRAEIIAVGSELLTPNRADSNSLFITARLNDIGVEVGAKHIVGDRRADLLSVLAESLRRSDLIVVTGGLGPTDDDITRTVAAEAVGAPLVEDAGLIERIRNRFAARGLVMPEINRRQALVPSGATILANDRGTAPGLLLEHEGRAILLLPGPPREMKPMFERFVAAHLAPAAGGARIRRRVLCIAGRTESQVDEIAQPVYNAWLGDVPPIATSILSVSGQIELHLSVRTDTVEEGDARLAHAAALLRAVLGSDVFSDDGRSLEQVVGERLLQRGWRVAVAESCTGGLVSSRLTDVPGSSAYMERGAVCYSNQAKTDLAGVAASIIEANGAVSEPVAVAMAVGIRDRAGVEAGLATTGIAGPGGGSDVKPVGTVAVAIAVPDGEEVRTYRFLGDRSQVKFQASQAVLDMLRRRLER